MEPASDDRKNNGISLIWKIHNYNFCVLSNSHFNNGYLQSPAFKFNDTQEFSLLVYTSKGRHLPGSNEIGFRIFITDGKNPGWQIDYEISILKNSGLFKRLGTRTLTYATSSYYTSPFDFLKCSSIDEDADDLSKYLNNDTLTLKCRIFKANNVFLDRQICCVHTVYNAERTIYNWNIDTVCNSNKLIFQANAKPNLFTTKKFIIHAFLVKDECSNVRVLEVTIKRNNMGKPLSFSICTISVVEDGKIIHSKQYEHSFQKSLEEQIWRVSFTPNINFINNEKENCKRFLRFEFATSDLSCTIEKIEHGESEEVSNLVSGQSTYSNGVQYWKDNLQHFFSEGKLSDVILRTPTKEFPAHKVMLCAQSNVFNAMFEHDTKENQTGVVEIEDLEDETVSMLLHYVYTGVFEKYDWETATNLYFAADKYEITALKEQCSILLKKNLSTSNVCKCLILADMHQDQPLKTFAQEFVLKRSSVVMKSEEWKDLIKNQGTLAAETMYLLFLKNS